MAKYEVTLPKDVIPRYPDQCVICREESQGVRVRVGAYSMHWWTLIFLTPGSRFVAEAPACFKCSQTYPRKRFYYHVGRIVTAMPLIIAAAIIGAWWIKPFNVMGLLAIFIDYRFWIVAVGALILHMPVHMVYDIYVEPPRFDITVYGKVVTYEFRKRVYARQFAALNKTTLDVEGEAPWEKFNKHPEKNNIQDGE